MSPIMLLCATLLPFHELHHLWMKSALPGKAELLTLGICCRIFSHGCRSDHQLSPHVPDYSLLTPISINLCEFRSAFLQLISAIFIADHPNAFPRPSRPRNQLPRCFRPLPDHPAPDIPFSPLSGPWRGGDSVGRIPEWKFWSENHCIGIDDGRDVN
jgi:hypothetical protein